MHFPQFLTADAEGIPLPKGQKTECCGVHTGHIPLIVYNREPGKPVSNALAGQFDVAFLGCPDGKEGLPVVFLEKALLQRMEKPAGNRLFFAGPQILQIDAQGLFPHAADPVISAVCN